VRSSSRLIQRTLQLIVQFGEIDESRGSPPRITPTLKDVPPRRPLQRTAKLWIALAIACTGFGRPKSAQL
jgi:hypothetical protein